MLHRRFLDRLDAGRELARRLRNYRDDSPIVLGLPRGGVPVAYEVARSLGAPLDVWVVRKVGAPSQPELGLGAVAEGGELYLDPHTVALVGVSQDELKALVAQKTAEVEERCVRFRKGAPPPVITDRTVIVVDDGIATGGTVRAALRALRRRGPRKLVLAVPVATPDTIESLRSLADEIMCVLPQENLYAIGLWYVDFSQVGDEEVTELLALAKSASPPLAAAKTTANGPIDRSVQIPVDNGVLDGDLVVPRFAQALVLFAHGSGSSRKSPRNRLVAERLRRAGLGTLLLDLLTADEEVADEIDAHLRFDIDLLATRLILATEWVRSAPETAALRVGYFGASTGSAAALIAAAKRPNDVGAVVSRGGRPDLAEGWLERVRAPTLLIIGGNDDVVLELNRRAAKSLVCPTRIEVVPGATHLFEEPGALAKVAELATTWFSERLAAGAVEARP